MTPRHRKIPFRALSLEASSRELPPPIAALFVVRFDPKVGYAVQWQRKLPEVVLDGAIEYKSLPSGLHNVKEDLIYFTHDAYSGVATFRNDPSVAAGSRSAEFTSVGILLRHAKGRFGRAWLHVPALKRLVQELISNADHIEPLEEYWAKYGENSSSQKETETPAAEQSARPEIVRNDLSPSHPVLSTEQLLDEFGPLVFPIYRATILRKKILFLQKPPLCNVCHYVYIFSLLSSIPQSILDCLPVSRSLRSKALFNIVIHDLDRLTRHDDNNGSAEEEDSSGWIASTSDEILATKSKFSDVQIRMPAEKDTSNVGHMWPIIRIQDQEDIRATQRDLRRYKLLRQGLIELTSNSFEPYRDEETHDEQTRLLQEASNLPDNDIVVPEENSVTESLPWAAIAYDSFMWWASAGEKSALVEEEQENDRELLMTASEVCDSHNATILAPPRSSLPPGGFEIAVVAYFHRMTAVIFETLLDIMDAQQGADGDEPIIVTKIDLVRMGLDEWSKIDRAFLKELVRVYFKRDAVVQGASVECCGVKLY